MRKQKGINNITNPEETKRPKVITLGVGLLIPTGTGTAKCQVPTKCHVEVFLEKNHSSHFSKKLTTGDTYNNLFR